MEVDAACLLRACAFDYFAHSTAGVSPDVPLMRSILFIAVMALVPLVPAVGQAQAALDRQLVVQQLSEASRGAAGQGYREEPRVFDSRSVVGMLPRGGQVVLEANLRAGERYTVVAVCDEECGDLDLRAHAPEGQEVLDEDVSTDNVPILTFTAEATGPHPISVIMSACSAERCYFGLKVLSR